MRTERYTHKLTGCAPIPLAHYLKALGIMRLVGDEKVDPDAHGWWSGDVFCLRTSLNRSGLLDFFRSKYVPTPLVVPWSGADFFAADRNPKPSTFQSRYPVKSPRKLRPSGAQSIESLLATTTDRLKEYRSIIKEVLSVMAGLGLETKSSIEGSAGETRKHLLLKGLRNTLSDDFVRWIDAAVLLGSEETEGFNKLLGSGGGSDGNSHFSDNFMQCLWLVLPDFDAQRNSPVLATTGEFDPVAALEQSIFGTSEGGTKVADLSPGLFNSQAVGGVNASSRDSTEAASNPWDYVLMMEGLLLFAGAMSKRTGALSPPTATFPFMVRLSAAGAGSLVSDESQNREVWLPLWANPSRAMEVTSIFAEARLTVGNRFAATGLDAARALSSMGVDWGIEAYERFGIVKGRVGGDNYHSAISLGRWKARRAEQVDLVTEFDDWLLSYRRAASGENAPTNARRALRELEGCILDLCREHDAARRRVRLQAILIALARAEASLAKSKKWREETFQRPVPFLSGAWLADCHDGSSEFRLAASLAGMYSKSVGGFRQYLEPVDTSGQWPGWNEDSAAQCDVVWSAGSLENNLIAVLARRGIQAVQLGERTGEDTLIFPGKSRFHASLGDVGRFLSEQSDDAKIAELTRSLSLVDWRNIDRDLQLSGGDREPIPDGTFALLKLCHAAYPVREVEVRLEPTIARLAIADRLADATTAAAKRLLGSGLPPAFNAAARAGGSARRIAAALLFPIGLTDMQTLADIVLKPQLEA